MAALIVLYDACILYSAPLRDLLMRLALTDLYRAKWSKDIHEEWIRSLLKNRPDLTRACLENIRKKMDTHVRDSLVEGYETLIDGIVLPDPDDRHVVAAAVRAKAQLIVTFNLSDFPAKRLAKYGIVAQHPDHFLLQLIEGDSYTVIKMVRETRLSLKNPPKTASEYLKTLLQQSLPLTVNYLQKYLDLI
jgi:predicted nucleic acid-binding protein